MMSAILVLNNILIFVCCIKLFTATPPLIIGLFLTTCSTEIRLKYPRLYSQSKNVFNYKMFFTWIVIAVLHSILLFWICSYTMQNEVIWANGKVGDYSVLGNTIYTVGSIFFFFKLMWILSNYFNYLFWFHTFCFLVYFDYRVP